MFAFGINEESSLAVRIAERGIHGIDPIDPLVWPSHFIHLPTGLTDDGEICLADGGTGFSCGTARIWVDSYRGADVFALALAPFLCCSSFAAQFRRSREHYSRRVERQPPS